MTEGRSRPPTLQREEIFGILRTSVDRISELAIDALPSELEPAGYAEAWSIPAVVAHLRACNDVLGGAMLRIIREDRPAWRAASPRRWQAKSGYHDLAFAPVFDLFAKSRNELLVAGCSSEP